MEERVESTTARVSGEAAEKDSQEQTDCVYDDGEDRIYESF